MTIEAAPVERVRLAKDEVQDEEIVTIDVRKERIRVQGVTATGQLRNENL